MQGREPFSSGIAEGLSKPELTRCRETLLMFKKAIMYYITRNRKDRKIPKLRDVLLKVIAQAASRARARREKLKNQTIEDLADENSYLNESQFDNLKRQFQKIKG